jgi:hypothetical protein
VFLLCWEHDPSYIYLDAMITKMSTFQGADMVLRWEKLLLREYLSLEVLTIEH